MEIANTRRFDVTISNEIAPYLKFLVDAIKARSTTAVTNQAVDNVAMAVATGVRKAMQGAEDP